MLSISLGLYLGVDVPGHIAALINLGGVATLFSEVATTRRFSQPCLIRPGSLASHKLVMGFCA